MPIPITCSRCGATREVKDKYAGLKVQCKNCGEFVRVDAVEVIEDVEVIDDPVPVVTSRRPPRSRDRARPRREGMHLGVVAGLFAVGLVLIAGLAVAIVYGVRAGFGSLDTAASAPPPKSPSNVPALSNFGKGPNTAAPAEAKVAGDVSVTLSNLRRVDGFPHRQGYEVDYVFATGEARPGETYYLMVRTSSGTSDVWYSHFQFKNQGTLKIEQFGPGGSGGGSVEVWLELQDMRNPRNRERVSNKLSI